MSALTFEHLEHALPTVTDETLAAKAALVCDGESDASVASVPAVVEADRRLVGANPMMLGLVTAWRADEPNLSHLTIDRGTRSDRLAREVERKRDAVIPRAVPGPFAGLPDFNEARLKQLDKRRKAKAERKRSRRK